MIDKKNPTIVQMIIVLMVIAMVCSAGVAAVYNATKDKIAAQEALKLQKSLETVLPKSLGYDNDITKTIDTIKLDKAVCICYIAKKGNEPVAYAIKSFNKKGYNGKVEVITGFMPNGDIINTQATVLAETPGLGMKAAEPKYHDQFNGKNPERFNLKVKKDGGEVDAISAATITSRAYALCVATSHQALMQYLNKSVNANSGATNSANPNADERGLENDD
ncbi:MAG: RnfABCDGE type electron transport complex subunit G [Bacteroidales bacterium]|nr:RnfABCDGE type electron transport complex subunit G [Bacteroidales bacterium]